MSLANLTHNALKFSNKSRQSSVSTEPLHTSRDFYIGLSLALLSSFFIGSSFILKKKGLLKLCGSMTISPNKRAGQGGYGYLKEWIWWSGFLTMGVGELCNFAAYGFVPATLVTPLGALSVLISAVMSAYFLNEKLNLIGKIGCILTAIGSTVMVIHAPKEGEVKTVQELIFRIKDKEFISFSILCLLTLVVLIFYVAPKYGHTNVFIYILICSILGAFTVMSCKGLSLGIKEMFFTEPSVSFVYTYFFALLVICCIIIQMNYLNKSLDLFNTPIVTTIYYVLFTLFVMIASAILFKELLNVSFTDFVGCISGFLTIICALFLIQFFKSSEDGNQTKQSNLVRNDNGNLFNLILNNSKKMTSESDDLIESYKLNDFGEKKRHISNIQDSSQASPTRNSSDLVKSVTIFKTAEREIRDKSSRDSPKNVSFMKKISANYKNFQHNILSPKSSSGYRQIPLDLADEEDFSNEECDIEFDLNQYKKNRKYNLLNNKDDNEIKSMKPVKQTASIKSKSFNDNIFVENTSTDSKSDDLNSATKSLIELRS